MSDPTASTPPDRARDWLDPERHLYRDEEGTVRFARGPHRGAPAADHVGDLQSMLDEPFEEGTKQAVRRVLFELDERFW